MALHARMLDAAERELGVRHRHGATDLSRRLPAIMVAAQQIAASVTHGLHGRRQAGVGKSFWQFRPFVSGESAAAVDWRRSARDDRTYIREREWEVAQTVWLWIDRSPSMAFESTLASQSKLDRALTLGLAAADLLVRGGERVGLHGLTRAFAARTVVDRLAEALVADERLAAPAEELPRPTPLPSRSRAILFSDFLAEPEAIARTITALSTNGAVGQLVMIVDPMEETFPFEGHVELLDSDTPARLRLGEARGLRETYIGKLTAHRAAITEAARSHGWALTIHRTDQPAAPALLALAMSLGAAPRGIG